MKVLILANQQLGLYKFRKELIEEMVSCGHRVYVSVPEDEFTENIKELGCMMIPNRQLDRRGKNPLHDLKLIRCYIRLMKKINPDVVLTYTIKPNVYGGMACSILRIPYVSNITGLGTSIENGGFISFITILLYRIGAKRAQTVFFQNRENCQYMLDRHVVDKEKSRLIPGSGVNTTLHCYEPYPSDENGIIITTITRIMKDKGIDEIIEAAECIKKDHPEVRFLLIGDFDEDYEKEINVLDKRGIIRYLGIQKDVHPYIARSHAVLHASYHEGMSNVLQEAASTGRPVLATNVPGCREIFEDNVTGIGFKPKDTKDLIRAVKRFLNLKNERREEMGRYGREKMVREFDRSIVIKKYMEEIRKAERVNDTRII